MRFHDVDLDVYLATALCAPRAYSLAVMFTFQTDLVALRSHILSLELLVLYPPVIDLFGQVHGMY
jgi:hypothetical protein